MHITLTTKKISDRKSLRHKEVANAAGMHPFNYSKVEKGERDSSIDALVQIVKLLGLTIDQLIQYEGKIPKEVTVIDKTSNEKPQLIEQLDEEDKSALYRIVDCMLAKKQFKDFFQKTLLHYK